MHVRGLLPPLLVVLVGAAFLGLVQLMRPFPFATTDDNWMYFLPLIKAHTDSLLSGDFLQALWSLGAGWTPWENAQVGPFYFPYHLANLGARLLGEPLALLEVSSAIHILAAGLVTFGLLPGDKTPGERVGWACLSMVQPGPFLLGLNWHIYLSSYPWFLALALLGLRREEEGLPGRQARLAMLGCNLGFFLASHVQMFVLGWMMLLPWWFATAGREGWLGRIRMTLALQLPLVPVLAFLKLASLDGNPNWMQGRDNPRYILAAAQDAGTVLAGTLWGNLGAPAGFKLWGTAWTGAGMLFSPPLLLVPALALWKRRWGIAAFFLFCFMFLAAASFPFVRFLGYGPLEGFRWTWKAVIVTGPLAFLTLAVLAESLRIPRKALRAGVPILAALSALVCLKGTDFDIWPSLSAAHPFGARQLVRTTQDFATAAGLPPGSRVALVGEVDMVQPLPLPYLGLVGNAPLLAGLETAHIYEPMESALAAKAHFSLNLPWRQAVPESNYVADPGKVEGALRRIGVQALICPTPGILVGAVGYRDPLGRTLFVKKLEHGPGTYPWGRFQGRDLPLLRLPGGRLRTQEPLPEPPQVLNPRGMDWRRLGDGHWQAVPRGPSRLWALLTILGLGAACLLLCSPAGKGRRRFETSGNGGAS